MVSRNAEKSGSKIELFAKAQRMAGKVNRQAKETGKREHGHVICGPITKDRLRPS